MDHASGAAQDKITPDLDPDTLELALGVSTEDISHGLAMIEVPFRICRRGVGSSLVIGTCVTNPDPALCKALEKAHPLLSSGQIWAFRRDDRRSRVTGYVEYRPVIGVKVVWKFRQAGSNSPLDEQLRYYSWYLLTTTPEK